ncbi:MAG: tandem-95 repeat protein [Hyphomonadaceae bacterium]|nr:tandem-95 repeat protein [Hyphomonadaceae bacterium]
MKKFFSVETTENLINAELGLLPTQNDTALDVVLFAQVEATDGATIDPGAVNVVLDENATVEDGFIIIDGVAIPADIAQGEVEEIEPEAAPAPLSGGGSAQPFELGDIGPNIDITDLLPPTALLFTIPEEEELAPFADEEASLEIVPDTGTVAEPALDVGSNPDPDGIITTGEILVDTGTSGSATLVINGVDVTNGGTVEGDYGILIITVTPDGNYDYEYDLTEVVDHPNAGSSGTSEGITDDFDVVLTDGTGASVADTLVIEIIDDGPTAVDDDGGSVPEDTAVTIDVFEDDTPGADGVDADTGVELVVGSLSGTGTVTDNGDGTFTYDPGPGEEGDVTFDYIITDGDGDTSTATVTITLEPDSEPTIVVNPEASIVDEAALSDGSNASSDAESTSGDFTIDTGNDSLETLVIDDVDVTNGGTVTGTYGVLTVTETNGAYTWSYELADSTADHAAGNVSEDFNVVVTDSDGDSASDSLVVNIADDVPTANDDSAGQMGENNPVTVDVFANDVEGADGVDTDSGVAVVPGTLSGNGDLVDNGDGTFTYTPEPGEEGSVTFEYEITDADGDTSIATATITLEADSAPVLESDSGSVDESALVSGSDAVSTDETTTGGIFIDTGNDSVGTLVIDGIDVTSGGTVNGTYGVLTVTETNGDYTYSYELTDNTTDHANGAVVEDFNVEVTDSDGDVVSDTLTIDVLDDSPSAENDSNTATEGGADATGNVLDNDTIGADDGIVGTDSVVSLDSPAVGTFGTLTLNADGTYVYTPNASVPAGSVDSFDYTLTDADGDVATATLTITFEGDNNVPTATTDASTLSDLGGDDNTDGSNADAFVPVSDTGDLNFDFGLDGAGTFGTNYDGGLGTATTVSAAGSTTIAADDGSWTLVIDETTGEYTFTQNTAYDHDLAADSDSGIVTVTITDSDGSPISVDINLAINDDVPVANNDTDGATEGGPAVVGDVLINDDIGADHGTVGTDSVASLDSPAVGTYGTLTLNADGTYSYTPNASVPAGSTDSFDYTVTDADGDTATATLTISFTGDNNAPVAMGNEAALSDVAGDDNTDGSNADAFVPQDTSGSLNFDFGLDGPAATDSFTLAYDGNLGPATATSNAGVTTLAADDGSWNITINEASGDYTFTQTGPYAHELGANSDDATLTITITDSDGSTSEVPLFLSIGDDVPVANNDTDGATEGAANVSMGNVLDNDDIGADHGTVGTDSTTTLVGDGIGTYGTLVLNADGSYTYTPNASVDAGSTDTFTYTLTDADGDTDTATLEFMFAGDNNVPTATADASTLSDVSGDDNTDGSNADAFVPVSDSGDLNIDFGLDGAGTFGTNYDGGLGAATTTSAAGETTIAADDGSWTLVIDETTGEYTFTQNTAYAHDLGADSDAGVVSVNITDSDGSPISVDINLTINDDVPVANNDTDGATEGAANVSMGNVLDNDDIGADHGTVGIDSTTTLVGNGVGTHGTLVLNADGSYTYTPNASVDAGSVDTFTYTLTDADGDTDTATIELTFAGDNNVPTAGTTTALADEDDLMGGNIDSAPGDDNPEDLSGILTHDYGVDGSGSITLLDGAQTVNGVDYTYTVSLDLNGDQVITANDGSQDVFTLTLTDDVAGTYQVELLASIEHLGTSDPAFEDNLFFSLGYQVEDSDGSTVDGTFALTIDDDIPLATNDSAMAAEDLPVDIDIKDNIMEGADGVDLVNDVSFNDTGTAGTVVYNGDGTFTFTPTPGFEGDTSFNYTILDGDGDAATATITISVAGDSEPTVTVTDLTVNEDGLANGTDSATNSETDASGVMTIDTGADSLTQVEIQDATGTWIDVTAATVGTPITVNGDDGILSVTSDGAGNYSYSYTLNTNLDHPDFDPNDGDGISDADDPLSGNDTDSFAVRVSDNDGDTSTSTPTDAGIIDITVLDDAPIAELNLVEGASIIVDESLGENAGEIEGNAEGLGQVTVVAASLFTDTSVFGADGAATTDSTVYSLNITSAVDTGLVDVSTGESIVLVDNAGIVEGRSDTTNELVFTVEVAANGDMTVTQLRALEHDDPLDSDEAGSPEILGAGFVELEVQVTDGDGDVDTASVDLGGIIAFEDDGPTIDASVADNDSVLLTTQDAETIGAAFDMDTSTADFGGAFAIDSSSYGSDGAGTTVWAYSLSVDNAVSGLSSDGDAINLYLIGGEVIGSTAAGAGSVTAGNTIFSIATNATTGEVTLTQFAEIDHDLPGVDSNYDTQLEVLAEGLVSLEGTATITDRDGDSASETLTLDLGGNIQFADDGPTVTATPTMAELIVDETDLTTDATADLSGAFAVNYGADGAGSTTFALDISADGVDSGLVDVATDEAVLLRINGSGEVEGYTATSDDVVFTVSVDGNGVVELDQIRAVEHDPNTGPDQATGLSADDLITLSATATDGDGDTATDTIDLAGALTFEDDAPSITATPTSANLIVDETDLMIDATADLSGAFTSSFGADGAGDITYGLSISVLDADSGLVDIETGEVVLLRINGSGEVEGYSASGGPVFTVSVDANGVVELDQIRAIEHSPDTGPDQFTGLTGSDLITLTARITDRDGDTDTATLDLTGALNFEDDAPDATLSGAALDTLVLDESPVGTETDGDSDPVGIATVSADFADNFGTTIDYGADGEGSVSYTLGLVGNDVASGLFTLGVNGAAGSEIVLNLVGGEIIGSASGTTYFTISVDNDPNSATFGEVTFSQSENVFHATTTDDDDTSALSIAANILTISQTVTDRDGDSDTATIDLGTGVFSIEDDGPNVEVSASGVETMLDETTAGEDFASGPIMVTSADAVINLDTEDYGSDGAGSLTYALTGAGATALVTADGDLPITLVQTDATTITGTFNGGADTAFSVVINTDGTVTVTQNVALEHNIDGDDTAGEHNDTLDLTGLITASATITDADGDSDTASAAIGDQIVFYDDGPSIQFTNNLIVDEDFITGGNMDIPVGPGDAAGGATDSTTATINFGADGPGTLDVVVGLTGPSGAGGLPPADLTSGGDDVLTIWDAGTNVLTGYTTDVNDPVFELTIDPNTGNYQFELFQQIDHVYTDADLMNNGPDTAYEDLFSIQFIATITDADGDTASDSFFVIIDDDSPNIDVIATGEGTIALITQDADTDPGTDTSTGDFSTVFSIDSSAYGADGPGTTTALNYVLSLAVADGTDSGLTSDGDVINLFNIGGVIYGSTTANAADAVTEAVFSIAVDGAGEVTLSQFEEIDHLPTDSASSNYDTQSIGLASGLVELTASAIITDNDGDAATDSETIDIGDNISFEDDGPSVTAVADTNEGVALDEGDTDAGAGATSTAATIDTNGIVIGDDPDVAGTGAITSGSSADALVDVTALFGADGPQGVDADAATTFALSVTNAVSGLTTTDGSAINLVDVNGDGSVIVGQVSGGTYDGQAAFAIEINGDSGIVNVEQYLSLNHPTAHDGTNTGSDYDETVSLDAGSLSVIVTVTDGDGDTDTSDAVNVGSQITFDDDGPAVSIPNALTVDEDFIADGNMDMPVGFGDTAGGASDSDTATIDFGSDGEGTNEIIVEIDLFGTAGIPGAPAIAELTSNGLALEYNWDNATNIFTASTDDGLTVTDVFTLEVNPVTGLYTFTLIEQLDHPLTDDLNPGNGLETSYEDLIGIFFNITVTDGDGDSVVERIIVNINDDSPTIDVVATDEATTTLLTQDADTESGTDTDVSVADFGGVFAIDSSSYGADGAGTTTDLAYALNLAVAEGATSGMTSGGVAVNLFTVAGVIYGSTTANAADAVTEAVFSIAVDGTGQVTLSQFEAIDHSAGGPNPDYDTQVETLANGLVELTASATITDSDGDAVTDSETIDLGGNISFADDGPIANDDADMAQEGGGAIMGTVMTNDDVGADEGTFGTDSFVSLTSSATGTYGTLALNADGTYTYTPFANTSVPEGSTDVFTYDLTDADGDTDPATLTITFEGDAFGPSATSASAMTSDVPGDDSITGSNTDAFTPQSTGGSLSFDFGVDGANTVSSFSTSYDGGLGTAMTTSAAGVTTIAADDGSWMVEINETTGAYTFTQNTAYDHAPGTSTDGAVVQVTITDSDGSMATVNLNLSIDDDVPTAYAPVATTTENDGTGTDTGDLNLDLGADLPGSATFINGTDGDPLTGSIDNGATQALTSGGNPITLSGYGTNVLTATADGQTVFTATLNVDTDDYTIEWFDTIDNGAAVNFTGLGFTQAGNPRFQMTDGPENDNGDSQDLLFSAYENGDQTQPATVNTDSSDVSVNNQGAGTDDGEGIRIDFVLNGSVQGSNFNNNEYEYDAHFNANGFTFTIADVGNTGSTDAVIRVFDADDDDPAPAGSGSPTDHSNNLSDDNASQDTITEIRVNGEVLDLIGGTPSTDGIVVSTDSNGDYVVNNLESGDIVEVSSADGFNRIEIENHGEAPNIDGGDGFSIRNFELRTEIEGGDVNFNLDVDATDADGDSITSMIDVTLTSGAPVMPKFTAPEMSNDMSALFIAANDMVDDFGFDAGSMARGSMNSGFNGMAVLLGGMAMATEANVFENIFEALQPSFEANDFGGIASDFAAGDFDNMIEMAFETVNGLDDMMTGQEAGFDASSLSSASPFTGEDLGTADLLGSAFEGMQTSMESISAPEMGGTDLAPATFEAGFGMPDLDMANQFFADTELDDLLAQMPGIAADASLAADNIEAINVDAGADITMGINLGTFQLGGSDGLIPNGIDQGQTLQGLDDFHILAVANSIAVI